MILLFKYSVIYGAYIDQDWGGHDDEVGLGWS